MKDEKRKQGGRDSATDGTGRAGGPGEAAGNEAEDAGAAPPAGEAGAADGFNIDPSSLTKEEVRELLEKAKSADEYLEKLQYCLAGFQNFRKRTEKEKEDWRRYGISNLALDLLPVLDNMERALSASALDAESRCIEEGLKLIQQMITDVLSRYGLRQIEAAGRPFDSCYHDSMGFGQDGSPNTVVAVLVKGYMLHDRVLRPAQVLVAGPAPGGGKAECRPEGAGDRDAGPGDAQEKES